MKWQDVIVRRYKTKFDEKEIDIDEVLREIERDIESAFEILARAGLDNITAVSIAGDIHDIVKHQEVRDKYRAQYEVIKLWNSMQYYIDRVGFLKEQGLDWELANEPFNNLDDKVQEVVAKEFKQYLEKHIEIQELWDKADKELRFNAVYNVLKGIEDAKKIVLAGYLSTFNWDAITDEALRAIAHIKYATMRGYDLTKADDWKRLLSNNRIYWHKLTSKTHSDIEYYDRLSERERAEILKVLSKAAEIINIPEAKGIEKESKQIFSEVIKNISIKQRIKFTELLLQYIRDYKKGKSLEIPHVEEKTDIDKLQNRWTKLKDGGRKEVLDKIEKKHKVTIKDKDDLIKIDNVKELLDKLKQYGIDAEKLMNIYTKSEVDLRAKSYVENSWKKLTDVSRIKILNDIEKEMKLTITDKESLSKVEDVEVLANKIGVTLLDLYRHIYRNRHEIWDSVIKRLISKHNLQGIDILYINDLIKTLANKYYLEYDNMEFIIDLYLYAGVKVRDIDIEKVYRKITDVKMKVGHFRKKVMQNYTEDKLKRELQDKGVIKFVEEMLGKVYPSIDEFRKELNETQKQNLKKFLEFISETEIEAIISQDKEALKQALGENNLRYIGRYVCPGSRLFWYEISCKRARELEDELDKIVWSGYIDGSRATASVIDYDEAGLVIAEMVNVYKMSNNDIKEWMQVIDKIKEVAGRGEYKGFEATVLSEIAKLYREAGYTIRSFDDVEKMEIMDVLRWVSRYGTADNLLKKLESKIKTAIKVIEKGRGKIQTEEREIVPMTDEEKVLWQNMKFDISDIKTLEQWRQEVLKRTRGKDIIEWLKLLAKWVDLYGKDLRIFELIDKYGIRGFLRAAAVEVYPIKDLKELLSEIERLAKKGLQDYDELVLELLVFVDEVVDGIHKNQLDIDKWSRIVDSVDGRLSTIYDGLGLLALKRVADEIGLKIRSPEKEPSVKLTEQNISRELSDIIENVDKFKDELKEFYNSILNTVKVIEKDEKAIENLISEAVRVSDRLYRVINGLVRRIRCYVFIKTGNKIGRKGLSC